MFFQKFSISFIALSIFLNTIIVETATFYTLSESEYQEYKNQSAVLKNQSAVLKNQSAVIEFQRVVLGLTTCSRKIRNGVKVLQFKYMDWQFVQHFPNLQYSILLAVYPNTSFVGWRRTRVQQESKNALKTMTHMNRFCAIIHWLIFYDDYLRANMKKIASPYRNGRLELFATELRTTFKDEIHQYGIYVSPIIGLKLNKTWDVACTVGKHDAVDVDDEELTIKFMKSILTLFAKDTVAEKCNELMKKIFSRPYQITPAERKILTQNKWFMSVEMEDDD